MITKNKKNVSVENFHLFVTVALRALVRFMLLSCGVGEDS